MKLLTVTMHHKRNRMRRWDLENVEKNIGHYIEWHPNTGASQTKKN